MDLDYNGQHLFLFLDTAYVVWRIRSKHAITVGSTYTWRHMTTFRGISTTNAMDRTIIDIDTGHWLPSLQLRESQINSDQKNAGSYDYRQRSLLSKPDIPVIEHFDG